MAISFVTVLYWPQFLALLGLGPEAPRFVFEPKVNSLPFTYLMGLFGSIALFIIVPYGEELWRCITTARCRRTHESSTATAAYR